MLETHQLEVHQALTAMEAEAQSLYRVCHPTSSHVLVLAIVLQTAGVCVHEAFFALLEILEVAAATGAVTMATHAFVQDPELHPLQLTALRLQLGPGLSSTLCPL